MSIPVVQVEQVERDAPCRAWEITLNITKDGEQGYYIFNLYHRDWQEATDNPKPWADGDHSPHLIVGEAVPA